MISVLPEAVANAARTGEDRLSLELKSNGIMVPREQRGKSVDADSFRRTYRSPEAWCVTWI